MNGDGLTLNPGPEPEGTLQHLTLKAALIGFHRLKVKHTGINIARTIHYLLDRAVVTLKIGHFTLNNTENNTVAMKHLQRLLLDCELEGIVRVDFHHLNNRVHCYAHIINLCAAHIITSISKPKDSGLGDMALGYNDSDSDNDDNNVNDHNDHDSPEGGVDDLKLADHFDDEGDTRLRAWSTTLKLNPIKCARSLIHFLHSSDNRKLAFQQCIIDGNTQGWFTEKKPDGVDK
ncbi:hypothetical protein EDB83DRAFT_2520766 [Lactarius deliciosus]|nr:hypothetical protein EDB83DRAFT_2520766 [Lactarius deliciosus]